ncbi:MAG: sugar phosphate isomerase/epimerase [Armatimonadetes bacterium]|nr:sugar phosphate isomerase/epimerase [Armatimonadota bacterium]
MPDPSRLAYMASLGFTAWKPEDVCRCLADLGYGAVEWTLAHFDPRSHSDDEIAALMQVTRDAGLAVSEVVVQQDYVTRDEAARADRVAHTIECIEAAARHGVEALNLFSGPAPWDPNAPKLRKEMPEGEAWELVFRAFDELVPAAERHGVKLAVEAVFGMTVRDYYTTLPLMARYTSDGLGLNFDPSHYALYGNDVPWAVRQWGSRIFHVHLKDCVGVPGGLPGETFTFPLLGEGVVDWSAFLAALDDIGYGGYLSVEFEAFTYYRTVLKNDPAQAARLSMEQCRALLGA